MLNRTQKGTHFNQTAKSFLISHRLISRLPPKIHGGTSLAPLYRPLNRLLFCSPVSKNMAKLSHISTRQIFQRYRTFK